MKEKTNTKAKVRFGLILTAILVLMLVMDYFAPVAFDIIILCLALIAANEFRILMRKAGYPPIKYGPVVACALIFVAFIVCYLCKLPAYLTLLIEMALIGLMYLCFYLLGVFFMRKKVKQDAFRLATNMGVSGFSYFKANNTLSAVIYPTALLMFIYFINHIQELGLSLTSKVQGVPYGLFGLVLLFSISCLTDTFAMIFGCLIKGVKIFPKISPKKTLAGALFGIVGGIGGALLALYTFRLIFGGIFVTLAFWQLIIIGAVGSIVTQAGDLFESFIKRRANEKEAGDFFHSHGGVLDRFDSITFCAPYIFVCLILLFA